MNPEIEVVDENISDNIENIVTENEGDVIGTDRVVENIEVQEDENIIDDREINIPKSLLKYYITKGN